jgi:CRP-like cAMP-binding protein
MLSLVPPTTIRSAPASRLQSRPAPSTVAFPTTDYPTSTKVYEFRRREQLPVDEGIIWQIVSGSVRTITWTADGDVTTLGIWGVGSIIGQPLSRINPYQIDCLTSVQLVICYGSIQQIAPALLHHIQEMEQLLSLCQVRSISDRLWQVLIWLADRFGKNHPQGRTTGIALTQQQLADLIGTTRVTVTRLLSDFRKMGLIEKLPKQEIVLKQTELLGN